MSEVEEPARPLEVFDVNVTPKKRVAFSRSVIVFSETAEPFQHQIESKMGVFVHMFQNDKATTLEQTAYNMEYLEREPRLTILKRDIKGVPTHKEVRRLREKHMEKRNNPKPDKTIIEKVKDKVFPDKEKKKLQDEVKALKKELAESKKEKESKTGK